MPGCARLSDLRGLALAALIVGCGGAAAADRPSRVVSMNLCTDQLALLLADPDQILSLSFLSHDPRSSAMADAARAYPANHGRAEEVYLMAPDLVLAGTWTSRAAVGILRRLGLRVEELPPETGFDDLRAHLRRMGEWLDQQDRAEALIARFDADLARLETRGVGRGRVALYSANGYTTGEGTLAADILAAAGLANIAAEAGIPGGGTLPLERLILLAPDAVVTDRPYPGESRAEAIMDHPALAALDLPVSADQGAQWTCGTPAVLDAVREMADLARRIEARR